jgi:hypothetical protein
MANDKSLAETPPRCRSRPRGTQFSETALATLCPPARRPSKGSIKTEWKASTRQRVRCKVPSSSTSSAERHEVCSQGTTGTARSCELGQGCPDLETPRLRKSSIQVRIGFTDHMPEKGDGRCVSFDSPLRFGDHSCSLLNRIIEFAATVVPVDSRTKFLARRDTARPSGSYLKALRCLLNRCPLHAGERLAHHEVPASRKERASDCGRPPELVALPRTSSRSHER